MNTSFNPNKRNSRHQLAFQLPGGSVEASQNAMNVLQYHKAAQFNREVSLQKASRSSNLRPWEGAGNHGKGAPGEPSTLQLQNGGAANGLMQSHHINNSSAEPAKPFQRSQRSQASQPYQNQNGLNLNQINQQINQMMNSEKFQLIFKDLEEKSKEQGLASRTKKDLQDMLEMKAALNHASNAPGYIQYEFTNERAERSGRWSCNEEAGSSLRANDNGPDHANPFESNPVDSSASSKAQTSQLAHPRKSASNS